MTLKSVKMWVVRAVAKDANGTVLYFTVETNEPAIAHERVRNFCKGTMGKSDWDVEQPVLPKRM